MLTIKIKDVPANYWLWKWGEFDYDVPLTFFIDNASVSLKFVDNNFGKRNDMEFTMGIILDIQISQPSPELVMSLKKNNKSASQFAAEYIHKIATETLQQLETYCRWALKIENILSSAKVGINTLFYGEVMLGKSEPKVTWSVNKTDYFLFEPKFKKSRKKHPALRSASLLTPAKWRKLQEFVDANSMPAKEIRELYKIKQKVAWNEKRVPVIETVSLLEVILRNKLQVAVIQKGVSSSQIKKMEIEIGLSFLINLMLPIALTNGENNKLKKEIESLNELRKIRNKIMHENLSEDKIDKDKIYMAINSAIKIIAVLDKKYPNV